MSYRTSRTERTGQRSLCGSYGSRQGSPLPSHRSSRDSGDDLWADRPLDLDPARVSHIPVSQSVRHPSGVAGSITISDPRVVGATPLRPVARKLAPTRGASPPTGALSYRTSRTSRTGRTDRMRAVAMTYRRGRRGGGADERGGDDLSDGAAGRTSAMLPPLLTKVGKKLVDLWRSTTL